MGLSFTNTGGESTSIAINTSSRPSGVEMLTSSELALTEVYPPTTYTDIRAIKEAVAETRNRLVTEDINQYLSLKHVSPNDFSFIDAHRRQLGAVRFTYFEDISTLIIKVPIRAHEIGHRNFERMISSQFGTMNIGIDQFLSLGATLYVGPTASKKEGTVHSRTLSYDLYRVTGRPWY